LSLTGHESIVESPERKLRWVDESATAAFAQALAQRAAIGDAIIALHGDLGAGKTTFVRHLLRALGIEGRIKSPSYAVVEPHQTNSLNIWHFDFYRFNDPREFEEAGFRDLFAAPGLKLIEWPEKAQGVLPQVDLDIHIDAQADESRSVRLLARTRAGRELIA
jgi:tRNA threonylcarbamoyladenosine biosynthesis protein TsaE